MLFLQSFFPHRPKLENKQVYKVKEEGVNFKDVVPPFSPALPYAELFMHQENITLDLSARPLGHFVTIQMPAYIGLLRVCLALWFTASGLLLSHHRSLDRRGAMASCIGCVYMCVSMNNCFNLSCIYVTDIFTNKM